jgi:hypothetical protein
MLNKIRDIVRFINFPTLASGRVRVSGIPTKNYLSTFAPDAPAVADVDRFVTTTDMKVGAYTVANASPPDGLCRNVTISITAVVGADTMGTILVTGTDYNSEVITETITPVVDTTVVGIKAFKTVTEVVGAGWVTSAPAEEDQITVGFGDVVGFSSKIKSGEVILAVWNQVVVALPTVTYSNEISKCTFTLPAAGDSAKKMIIGMIKYVGI